MLKTKRALSNNTLATSKFYGQILHEYNLRFIRDGVVNGRRFFFEVIAPLLPEYKMQSWYQFLRRFKTANGLAAAQVGVAPIMGLQEKRAEENDFQKNLVASEVATHKGINLALNLGMQRLMKLVEDPDEVAKMSGKDVIDLLFKAMKAQDSRIHAIGKIKEDDREEKKFNRVFNQGIYGS